MYCFGELIALHAAHNPQRFVAVLLNHSWKAGVTFEPKGVLDLAGERDGANRGKYNITTRRSEDQLVGPGTMTQGSVHTNSTCFKTDIH